MSALLVRLCAFARERTTNPRTPAPPSAQRVLRDARVSGFQAQHTLGRRLVERRKRVKIFGVERDLRADLATLSDFSAHADQKDLVDYAVALQERGPLKHVALVHGEPPAQTELTKKLREQGIPNVYAPATGTSIEV